MMVARVAHDKAVENYIGTLVKVDNGQRIQEEKRNVARQLVAEQNLSSGT